MFLDPIQHERTFLGTEKSMALKHITITIERHTDGLKVVTHTRDGKRSWLGTFRGTGAKRRAIDTMRRAAQAHEPRRPR